MEPAYGVKGDGAVPNRPCCYIFGAEYHKPEQVKEIRMDFKIGDILYHYVYDEGSVSEHMCHVVKVCPVIEYNRKTRKYSEAPDIFSLCYKKDTYPYHKYYVKSDSIDKQVIYKGGDPKIVVLSEKNFWKALDIFEKHFEERADHHDKCKSKFDKKRKNIQTLKAYCNESLRGYCYD